MYSSSEDYFFHRHRHYIDYTTCDVLHGLRGCTTLCLHIFSRHVSGGFYFGRVVNLCSEFSVAKLYDFGCNFCDREGRNKNKLHQQFIPFSVSVLAVVTNKVEAAIHIYIYIYIHVCIYIYIYIYTNKQVK